DSEKARTMSAAHLQDANHRLATAS
ncbi:GntR family transcriptional regulator, partial [Vibrio sp. 10N.286.49.F3]